jgi:hypothetical protein
MSLAGIGISHGYTYIVIMQGLRDLDHSGDYPAAACKNFFEISLICVLQAAMDLSFAHIFIGRIYGWKSFHEFRGEAYSAHVSSMLSRRAFVNCWRLRVFVTCALPENETVPCLGTAAADLSLWLGKQENWILKSVTDRGMPLPSHLKKASLLKIDSKLVGIYCVELLLVKDNEDRVSLLRSEEQLAIKQGQIEDAERYTAELMRLKAATPVVSRKDAQLLIQMLNMDMFSEILGDSHTAKHFPSVLTALHVFCRAYYKAQPDRARTETQNKFTQVSAFLNLDSIHSELLCLRSESELAGLVSKFPSVTKEFVISLVVSMYQACRTILVTNCRRIYL